MSSSDTRLSKFLSLVLRHEPEKAGITLDAAGWVDVETLLRGCAAAGVAVSRSDLDRIVAESDKQRFAFSDDRRRIRANQGHSVEVELAYEPLTPPDILFHGTADRFLESIRAQGLVRGKRHHVHLSAERSTAIEVGRRHGRPIVLQIDARRMHAEGIAFFRSANGVWLTEHVPARFLTLGTE
jgi:putative RNA 2'-phosphotransferase